MDLIFPDKPPETAEEFLNSFDNNQPRISQLALQHSAQLQAKLPFFLRQQKFLIGEKEHGGFSLWGVDPIDEMMKEIIDIDHYEWWHLLQVHFSS